MSLFFSNGCLFFKCHCDFQAFILCVSLFEYSKSCLLPQEWELGAVRGTHRGLSGQGLEQLWGARDQPSRGVAGAGAVLSMEQPIFLSHPLLLCSLTVETNQLMDTDRQTAETDCPQSAKARSPVPAHIVLQCL